MTNILKFLMKEKILLIPGLAFIAFFFVIIIYRIPAHIKNRRESKKWKKLIHDYMKKKK